MMISTIFAVGALAFLDSLNPFSIAAMAVVIAKGESPSQSMSRGLIFIGATFSAYFLGGVLILNGWVAALKALLPLITPLIVSIGWAASGLVSIGAAIYLWTKASNAKDQPPSKATPAALFGIFAFALISTISDLPTAIPLFGAVPLILGTKPSMLGIIGWLAFYCFVYVGPLFLILGLKLFGGQRLEPMLLKINKIMDWIVGRLTPPLLVALGIWCFTNLLSK